MRIVLLRPPRYVWPFNSETSAFWQPLGLLSLAAAARRDLAGMEIEVWDCPANWWGWRTLQARLAQRPIDVLGVGEETVSAHEAIRAAEMVKAIHPRCLVAAGGTYFAHAIEESLAGGAIDVIVRGEGEATFVELLACATDRSRWPGVAGIAFRNGGSIVRTSPRAMIEDLDSLPLPAYDLIDMSAYGRHSRNHPGLVAVEHSRGCVDSCGFCILWKHMGQSVDGNGKVAPCWRTKSPQRSFEDVAWLYSRFGRRTFGWVDPTFNVSPQWSDAWAELMLRSDLVDGRGRAKTVHTAWMRADGIVRDHKLGVLDKLVRAGLRQVMIGVERDDDAGLAQLGKHGNSAEVCRAAFAILRENYPEVYTIGTMIFGLPGDGRADIRRLSLVQYDYGMDYCFLMPLTPNPGTDMAPQAAAEQVARGVKPAAGTKGKSRTAVTVPLSAYNFHTPVQPTASLSLRELEATYWRLIFRPSWKRAALAARQLLLERHRRKRRVHLALLGRGTQIALKSLFRRLIHPRSAQPALYSRRPKWYDN